MRGQRSMRPAASATWHDMYALFVVPASQYDVLVKHGARTTWHTEIDVRSTARLWIVP